MLIIPKSGDRISSNIIHLLNSNINSHAIKIFIELCFKFQPKQLGLCLVRTSGSKLRSESGKSLLEMELRRLLMAVAVMKYLSLVQSADIFDDQ